MSTSQTQISQDINIDNLLQTGFETIVQAFELKTTAYQATLKEQNSTINELRTKIKLLKEEIEILKQENAFYKKENEQLRHNNLKLNSLLKNSKNRLMNIKHSMKEENDDYSNTNENECELNDTDNEYSKPLTDRREIQRKTNKENTKLNLFSHMNSHRSSSNIYSKNSKHSIHPIKKNMSSRNDPMMIPYKTTLDPYSNNGTYQINRPLSHSNSMKFNQRSQNSYQCNNEYNQYDNNNSNISNQSNISIQMKQSELMNQFLDQCKVYLTPVNYNRIVDSFQEYKDGLMTDDEIISRTRMNLQGNSTLLHLFESLFLI